MAQHDYVISNQPGAAFRADLNNALASIVSQNSGTAEPSTTYAYMMWADTTNGKLKMRNGANSAWIELGTLADAGLGILSNVPLGTVSAPGIAFAGDPNTGIYSPTTDQVAITTGGVQRLNITTAALLPTLPLRGADGTAANPAYSFSGDTDTGIYRIGANQLGIATGGSKVADFSGTQVEIAPRFRVVGDRIFQANSGGSDFEIGPGAGTGDATVWGFVAPSSRSMAFFAGGSERARIDSSALSLTGLQGIKFQASQSASSDANTLDDYEEGSWTPEIVGDSTNGTFTASYATGRYTKVGRVVHVFCIVGGTLSGATGSIIVRGLPFSPSIGSQTLSVNEQRYFNITGYTQMGFELTNGATYGYLYMNGISKSESPINVSNFASGGTSIVWLSGSYITT